MHEFGWKPHEWANLSHKEKIIVMASIDFHQEEEEKAQKKAEREAKSKSHRR